jgi:Flp pilus assembly pilin Flp
MFILSQTAKYLKNKSGQGMVEYMILVALIAAGTVGIIRVVGYNIGAQYENLNRALGAKTDTQLQVLNADPSQLSKKDLSDFLKGAR